MEDSSEKSLSPGAIPQETAFSIMFVSVGMSCFIYQTMLSGSMFYKARKPIIGLVFAQAALGIIVTFVTLLTSLIEVDCTFRLLFSVVGVNIGDMSLQFVLLWKAYLGNNRSKLILILGSIPILGIAAFICVNMTFGKSKTFLGVGLCATEYPTYIVISKAIIDCTANTFLSGCFILVIYRHYRILGSSIQKTLITEGLIYCFGVCFSNIATGILLTKNVLGGSTPILYTIDWYLASYLIIKQLRHRTTSIKVDDDSIDDDDNLTVESSISIRRNPDDDEELDTRRKDDRDTYYSSMDGTLVPTSPKSPKFSSEEKYPDIPPFEGKIFVPSGTLLLEEPHKYGVSKYASSITEIGEDEEDKIIKIQQKQITTRFNTNTLSKLSISHNIAGSSGSTEHNLRKE